MIRAVEHDTQNILAYLREDMANCLYLYTDVAKYGVDSENMKVWYDTDEKGIRVVVMKYHRNFQLYSNRDFSDVDGILKLIDEEKPMGIAGRKELICELEERLKDRYNCTYGFVFQCSLLEQEKLEEADKDCQAEIELAAPEDAAAIARLLFLDAEFRSVYTEESLTNELRERIETGMGRSYIIRDGDQIVAHNATYAESDRFVVASGMMIHPDYRKTEYAHWIDVKFALDLVREGKSCFSMAVKKKMIRWHKFSGDRVAAEYGKLSMIEKPGE